MIETLFESPKVLLAFVVVGVSILIVQYVSYSSNKFPIINVHPGEWSWAPARKRFVTDAASLLREGQAKTDGPFRLVTDRKVMTYLPPHYADLIKGDHRFSFTEYAHRDMMGFLPGFDAFGDLLKSGIVIDCVQKRVTTNMDAMSGILSSSAAQALNDRWGKDTSFHAINLHQTILQMVCQLTSRIFVGPELSRDPEWLDLSVTHTVDVFMGAKELGRYPWYTQRIVQWFHPRCQRVRSSLKKAYQLLNPVIEQRQRERAANGGKADHTDAIEWYSQVSNGRRYDEVVAQVGLAVAAIHTTGDLLFKTVSHIASHPDFIKDARQEIKHVVVTYGLNKTGCFHLTLLDSVAKETQRLDAVAMAIMTRYVKEDATLSNGVTIPKGSQTAVITDMMQSDKTYKNAAQFDPYRFYNLRKQGQESKSQLVSATPEHIAFGLGRHACPGRFFAAHEIKIMLAHILLKYDIEYVGGDKAGLRVVGTDRFADGSPRVQIRRRTDEDSKLLPDL